MERLCCFGVFELLFFFLNPAFRSFSNEQLSSMKENAEIVHSQLDMLEEIGGGGIRCCICEIF